MAGTGMAQDAGHREWGTQLTVQEKQKREQAELKAAAAKGECKCEWECERECVCAKERVD